MTAGPGYYDAASQYASQYSQYATQYMEKYNVNYGVLHQILLYCLAFSTLLFLSVCKPPRFYKNLISWIVQLKITVRKSKFRIYGLMLINIVILFVLLASKLDLITSSFKNGSELIF